jgi:hypothetical protein
MDDDAPIVKSDNNNINKDRRGINNPCSLFLIAIE